MAKLISATMENDVQFMGTSNGFLVTPYSNIRVEYECLVTLKELRLCLSLSRTNEKLVILNKKNSTETMSENERLHMRFKEHRYSGDGLLSEVSHTISSIYPENHPARYSSDRYTHTDENLINSVDYFKYFPFDVCPILNIHPNILTAKEMLGDTSQGFDIDDNLIVEYFNLLKLIS